MTISNNYRWPVDEVFLKDPVTYLSAAHGELAEEIYAPSWRLRGNQAILAAAVSVVVAVEIDRLPAEVFITPAWGTTVWVTDKTTSGFTAHFGTAPGADSSFDWLVIVSEAGP